LPSQAKVRLLSYLAITHSIPVGLSPTIITAKHLKDTAFHNNFFGFASCSLPNTAKLVDYTTVYNQGTAHCPLRIERLDALNTETVDELIMGI
jgi:hypothetical protein